MRGRSLFILEHRKGSLNLSLEPWKKNSNGSKERFRFEIRTYGQKLTDSPNEKFMLMILGSQVKLENDNRGVNVMRGLSGGGDSEKRKFLSNLRSMLIYRNQKIEVMG